MFVVYAVTNGDNSDVGDSYFQLDEITLRFRKQASKRTNNGLAVVIISN